MSSERNIELLCEISRATSLDEICNLTYHLTGNPVFISDLSHTMLAYTKCVEIKDPTWQQNVVQAHLQRNNLTQDREVGSVHYLSSTAQKPVLVEDEYLPYPRIIKSLFHKGRAIGVMVVTAYITPFSKNSLDIVDLISAFVVPQMLKERMFLQGSHKLENLFINILNGAVYSSAEVRSRLDILGYREPKHIYLLCIGEPKKKNSEADITKILEEYATATNGFAFLYNASLISVFGRDEPIVDWEDQMPRLAELLDDGGLQAGISREIEGLENLAVYYQQAQSALEMAIWLERPLKFNLYDTLSFFIMLLGVPEGNLNRYCHTEIQKLSEYDGIHGTDLCITLQVYLEQAKSLAKTAEILYIHRNTVRYRINKCMEFLGTDLEDGNEIFSYIMSLRIVEFKKKILPKIKHY